MLKQIQHAEFIFLGLWKLDTNLSHVHMDKFTYVIKFAHMQILLTMCNGIFPNLHMILKCPKRPGGVYAKNKNCHFKQYLYLGSQK